MMFNEAVKKLSATVGAKVDETFARPHTEAYVGQPLPGGRGITDHGGPKTEYILDDNIDSVEWESVEDDTEPPHQFIEPVPVRIVTGKALESKGFRTDSYTITPTSGPVTIRAKATRTKCFIRASIPFRISDQPNLFASYTTNSIVLETTANIYIGWDTFNVTDQTIVVSVLEEYTSLVRSE